MISDTKHAYTYTNNMCSHGYKITHSYMDRNVTN